MSFNDMPSAFLVCVIFIAATPKQANDIRFDQKKPIILTLNITQSGLTYFVKGLADDIVFADTTSDATLSSNFDNVSLRQNLIER